jgi:ribosome biogenesis protein Nip4
MSSQAFICANANEFNKAVLGGDAFYFNNQDEICNWINQPEDLNFVNQSIKNNVSKIETDYSWNSIVDAYENLITSKR